MIYFLISILYVLSCDAIGSIGESRKIGRSWSFIFSFLLTPILGYGITMLTREVDEDDIVSEIVYREVLQQMNLFTISFTRVISILLAINIMMFGFEVWLSMRGIISIIDPLTLHMGMKFRIHQLITHQFLHSGVSHLFGNMLILLMVGPSIEKRYGTKKTILGYLLFGIIAALIQMLVNNPNENTAGASGAVFGVLAIFAIIDPSRHSIFKWLKVKYIAIAIILLELNSLNVENDGIGHYAHFGGMLAGLIFYLTQKTDETEA